MHYHYTKERIEAVALSMCYIILYSNYTLENAI